MAQFQALDPKVEVNGQTVLSVANGLGTMSHMGFKILAEHGIVDPRPDMWYLQQLWLDVFKSISEKVGPRTLYQIGKSIPDNAKFPPGIDDIYKALAAIDVAYHMNHRLGKQVLFDPATGQMREGIGNYHYRKISDRRIEIECDNPYPCDFDKGIIEQMARRFKTADAIVKVDHNEVLGCRNKRGQSCIYAVQW